MTRYPRLCRFCGSPLADEGIGAYEFWGQKGIDHDWVCENPDCDPDHPTTTPAEDFDEPPEPLPVHPLWSPE